MLNKPNKQTINPTENQSVVLWGVSISPYVRKVMVALAEKELPYEQREILPKILLNATGQTIPADFEKASPLLAMSFLWQISLLLCNC